MIKNILILLCLLSLSLGTAIKGKVYDENNGTPLVGANVYLEDTSFGGSSAQ